MAYINTAYLFKCQTCRHFRSNECNTFCENGECYSPNMRMIPTADVVEVKHGEWEPIVKQDNYLEPPYCDTCKCSVCEYEIDVSETVYNYCPNCGAKMDGGKAE